jgi:hypothetical protein
MELLNAESKDLLGFQTPNGAVFTLLLAATIISAALAAFYESRLEQERVQARPTPHFRLSPRTFQDSALYTPIGQKYQRRARHHLLRMYLFALAGLFWKWLAP